MTDRKSKSFQERLKTFSENEHKKAMQLPPGPEREASLLKIQQAETASHLDDWANSTGSKMPE
jgi:hypothetical protein